MLKAVNQSFDDLDLLREQVVNIYNYKLGYLGDHRSDDHSGILDSGCCEGEAGCFF